MSTEIKTNQLVVPPVTLDDVLSTIASVEYFTAEEGINGRNLALADLHDPLTFLRIGDFDLGRIAVCVIICNNGHRVVGTAIGQSDSTSNLEKGKETAYQDALRKLFPMVVFASRQAALGAHLQLQNVRKFLLANFGRGLHELRPEELSTYMRALFAANPETSKEQHRWNVECAVQLVDYLTGEISQLKTSDGINANRVRELREQLEKLQTLSTSPSAKGGIGYHLYEVTTDEASGSEMERLYGEVHPTLKEAKSSLSAVGSRYHGIDYYDGTKWHYDVHHFNAGTNDHQHTGQQA